MPDHSLKLFAKPAR